MKCPVCGNVNTSRTCLKCGFDSSKDYVRYLTFGPVKKVTSVSSLRREWAKTQGATSALQNDKIPTAQDMSEKKPVQRDDAASAFQRARAYENGCGVEKNLVEAAKWYRKAADQGYASAQNGLGNCYYHGLGVEKDYQKAAYWHKKAAEQGHAEAQKNLGWCYDSGEGVKQDHQQAVYWYRKAADQGFARAQNNLGYCYERGNGVNQDYQQAVFWYNKAADQGDSLAQRNLGICYYVGRGVNCDYQQAAYWFLKAAENGESSVYLKLGDCYEKMNDLEQAIQYYQKAWENKLNPRRYLATFYKARCYAKLDRDGADRAAAELFYKLALNGAREAGDKLTVQKIQEAQKELKKKKSIFGWWK